MQSIKFDNLGKGQWLTAAGCLTSIALITAGVFELIPLADPQNYGWLQAAGHFILFLTLARMTLSRNLVQWNKKGVYIRINSFIGKSISFEDIRSIVIENDRLILRKIGYPKPKVYELQRVKPEYKRALAEWVESVNHAVQTRRPPPPVHMESFDHPDREVRVLDVQRQRD